MFVFHAVVHTFSRFSILQKNIWKFPKLYCKKLLKNRSTANVFCPPLQEICIMILKPQLQNSTVNLSKKSMMWSTTDLGTSNLRILVR